MEILIYLKTLILLITLSICGFIIVRRICKDSRLQLLLPTGVITGIGLYIFLLNSVAYIFKGPPGFYVALAIEIFIAYFLRRKIKPQKLLIPKKGEKLVWLIFLFLWAIFLFHVSATGHALSGDWAHHYILASLFGRGDFPTHSPFQPDRLTSPHIGVGEFLAASKLFTGGSYTFLGSILSFLTLLSISQILQWIIRIRLNLFSMILLPLIPLVALVSIGSFMIVWPYQLAMPEIHEGVLKWFSKLPLFYHTLEAFGTYVSLDSLNLFLHRMLALSIFTTILPLILFPAKKHIFFLSTILLVLISTMALIDEAVLIVSLPVINAALFFSLFQKNFRKWILFIVLLCLVIIFQGGLVSEVIFSSDKTLGKVLIFPDDGKGTAARFGMYRSFRLKQQSNKLIPDKQEYKPLRWFHPGLVMQLSVLFILSLAATLIFRKKTTDRSPILLTWLFFAVSVIAWIAFHGIVPKGIYHTNGSRFLSLSYQMSGVGIAFLIVLFFIYARGYNKFTKLLFFTVKLLIVWLLFVSIIPAFAALFPRKPYNWFVGVGTNLREEYKWIEKNLKVQSRMLAFMGKSPSSGPVAELVKEVGIFAPSWYEKPESYGFDVSPPYLDLFYTLNPKILEILKVEYIMVDQQYLSSLPVKRLTDLQNKDYFKIEYPEDNVPLQDIYILKVLPKYLKEGENFQGTYYELSEKLPDKGVVYMDEPPVGNIEDVLWRVVLLTMQIKDLEVYYNPRKLIFYNFAINVDAKFYGESDDKYGEPNNRYDYLVLRSETDPNLICNCEVTLFWSDIGGKINVWKVK